MNIYKITGEKFFFFSFFNKITIFSGKIKTTCCEAAVVKAQILTNRIKKESREIATGTPSVHSCDY